MTKPTDLKERLTEMSAKKLIKLIMPPRIVLVVRIRNQFEPTVRGVEVKLTKEQRRDLSLHSTREQILPDCCLRFITDGSDDRCDEPTSRDIVWMKAIVDAMPDMVDGEQLACDPAAATAAIRQIVDERDETLIENKRMKSFYSTEFASLQQKLHAVERDNRRLHEQLIKVQHENKRLTRELDEAQAEANRLRDRLCFDSGGSDKIDELEQAIQFLQSNLEVVIREREEMRSRVADLQREIESRRKTILTSIESFSHMINYINRLQKELAKYNPESSTPREFASASAKIEEGGDGEVR